MLYTLSVANVRSDKVEEYIRLMMGEFRPLAEKHGVRFVGSWRVIAGQREDVILLEAYKDMGDFERVRRDITADPACRQKLSEIIPLRTIFRRFLEPTEFSPLE